MDARVAVVGAGPAGAAIVAGLARAGIDAIGFDSQAGVAASGKTVVLRAAAMRTLREWGIAPGADLARPIRDARVDFENTPMRARLRPPRGLGFAVDLSEWHRALRAEIESKIVAPARVLAIRQTAREAQIDLSENRVCRAQAVVIAAPLPLPTEFATRDFDYGQSALTMTAAIDGISAGRGLGANRRRRRFRLGAARRRPLRSHLLRERGAHRSPVRIAGRRFVRAAASALCRASLRRFARALRLSAAPANERAAGSRARFFGRARRRRLAPDRRVGIKFGLGRRGGFDAAARAIF